MLWAVVTSLLAGVVSFAGTWLAWRNAVAWGLVAAPNERSSHTALTPTGGGIGMVLGGTLALGFAAFASPGPMLAIAIGGLLIAALGYYDDRWTLGAPVRLVAQIVLSAAVILLAVPLAGLRQGIGLPIPELVLGAVASIAMVYWLNLFNFMDGIDGIAGAQAVFMAGAAALLLALQGEGAVALFSVFVAFALAGAGFLLLNWPPAKIFMGDVGSTYLGFVLAALALISIAAGWMSLIQWAILGAAFVADASVTLLRRLLRGEKIMQAHRLHAYQALSRRWGGHRAVTLSFIGLNLIWLLPLAYLASAPAWALAALLTAYVPVTILALILGAGAPEAVTQQ